MSELPLTGACNCGAVRFEIDEPLISASYCHCTRCQKRSGAAAGASARIVDGSLRIVSGEELLTTWKPDTGNWKAFCSVCGSGMWSLRRDDGQISGLRLGLIEGDPGVRPSDRQWLDSAACWEAIPDDGLPRYPSRRPG